jgi:hypothetical protein
VNITKEETMNQRPPRFNPDYPGFIVPEAMCKTQLEIIDMVENGTFKQAQAKAEEEAIEGATK